MKPDGESMIFDYTVDKNGQWVHWSEHVTGLISWEIIYFGLVSKWFLFVEYIYPTDFTPDFHSILVPNVDNIRTDFLINTVAKQGKGVLLVGEQVSQDKLYFQYVVLYTTFIGKMIAWEAF